MVGGDEQRELRPQAAGVLNFNLRICSFILKVIRHRTFSGTLGFAVERDHPSSGGRIGQGTQKEADRRGVDTGVLIGVMGSEY